MATVFWDAKGVILLDILPQGQCINAARYCSTLDRLKEAIRRKRPGLLRRGVVLQHDNATPHSANLTQQWLQCYGWEILPHPAHSPDLAPSDFHLFGPLKRHLGGMAFETEDDLIISGLLGNILCPISPSEVVICNTDTVQSFDVSQKRTSFFKRVSRSAAQTITLSCVALCPSGHLIMCDQQTNTLFLTDSRGQYIRDLWTCPNSSYRINNYYHIDDDTAHAHLTVTYCGMYRIFTSTLV
ncbi:histone-lysine N-methyltransferase SETMAR [Plakobranchus ocellatus]|uniref:Histone-lysine N-methyltransferase SETMAR n=1 Tax=Plakobranchus ocellatus TaxID=259542 RepID=A0AAV4BL49_9GAST|nr:histone-lysine N-methyltransferase SETMAR [Plakobranchus ocellatus]